MDNSSVAEGNGDRNAVAGYLGNNNNNSTPISSPQRANAPPSRSPRKTPTSQNRPKKTQKSNEINSDISKIDDDVMHKNNDAGEDGNIDGGGIDLPPDISNIFEASIDNNNISTDGTTNVDDGDLFSALAMLVMGDGSSSNSSIHVPLIPEPPSTRTTAMDIPDDVKTRFTETRFTKCKFQFTGSKHINGAGTVRAGFKSPISSVERKAIKEFHGFNKYIKHRTEVKDQSREKMTRGFKGPSNRGVEELVHYKCGAAACRCEMKIARYDDVNGGSHILCYELVDEGTGQPFEHSNHDMSREQQKQYRKPNKQSKSNVETAKSKYTGMTMTQAQMEFVAKFGMGDVAIGDYMAVATAMKETCLLTTEQVQDLDGLASRIEKYVERRKLKEDPYFVNDWGKKDKKRRTR